MGENVLFWSQTGVCKIEVVYQITCRIKEERQMRHSMIKFLDSKIKRTFYKLQMGRKSCLPNKINHIDIEFYQQEASGITTKDTWKYMVIQPRHHLLQRRKDFCKGAGIENSLDLFCVRTRDERRYISSTMNLKRSPTKEEVEKET